MKKLILTSLVLGLLAGCANTPVLPAGGFAPATSDVVVKDMGFAGGHTIAVNLYSPIFEATKRSVLSEQAEPPCWALSDLYQYDVTLKDVNSGEVLTTFSVLCKTGRSKAVFNHLKPGKKYSITIVAKGNHGGTAPTTVLNALKPSIGYFDLTGVPADQGPRELSAAIQVELDCEGYGYDRTGRIDIIPVARNGQRMSNERESGEGTCYACGDFPVSAGTTFYDSTFEGGTNGDVFNTNPNHNHWTNAINGWAWVQRDLPVALPISRIDIAEAKNDPNFGTCTEIYLKLKKPDGSWVVADSLYNQNLSGYSKRLSPPVEAVAFKLELKSEKGWLSARGITLLADAGVPCPSTPPATTPPASTPPTTPSATPPTTPSAGPSTPPELPPCIVPSPSPVPSPSTPAATPTPATTPSPSPSSPVACSGPFASFTQGGWGSDPSGNNPGTFLQTHFNAMTGGTLSVGVGRTLTFTSAEAVRAFLPQGGTADVLGANATNPTTSAAGVLAGQLVAAKLNVLRSDAGLNPSGAVGKLRNVKYASGAFAELTIGDVLLIADRAIGGNMAALPAGATLSDLNSALTAINERFHDPGATPDGVVFDCP